MLILEEEEGCHRLVIAAPPALRHLAKVLSSRSRTVEGIEEDARVGDLGSPALSTDETFTRPPARKEDSTVEGQCTPAGGTRVGIYTPAGVPGWVYIHRPCSSSCGYTGPAPPPVGIPASCYPHSVYTGPPATRTVYIPVLLLPGVIYPALLLPGVIYPALLLPAVYAGPAPSCCICRPCSSLFFPVEVPPAPPCSSRLRSLLLFFLP